MLTGSLSFTKSRVQYSLSNLFEALGVARVSLPRWGWLAPTLIVLLAGVLRFYNLAHPNAIVFDETYYAKWLRLCPRILRSCILRLRIRLVIT